MRLDAGGTADGVSWNKAKIGEADLAHLIALPGVQMVSLRFTEMTGAGLAQLQGLPKLTSLYLPGAAVDDEGMKQLGQMTGLVNLYLQETKITDAGLEPLKGMTALRVLYLDENKLTDAGVAHLKGLTGLVGLYLRDTAVTEACLEHVKGMTRLAFLDVRNTKVTEEGVKKLREVLPKCDIKHGASLVQTEPVPAPVLVPVSLYDKDPGHLWNRVYSALMVRGPGAKPEENDLLDPPFYYSTPIFHTQRIRLPAPGVTKRSLIVINATPVKASPPSHTKRICSGPTCQRPPSTRRNAILSTASSAVGHPTATDGRSCAGSGTSRPGDNPGRPAVRHSSSCRKEKKITAFIAQRMHVTWELVKIGELVKIAALADAHRIALAPHNPQGPVSTAASLE